MLKYGCYSGFAPQNMEIRYLCPSIHRKIEKEQKQEFLLSSNKKQNDNKRHEYDTKLIA